MTMNKPTTNNSPPPGALALSQPTTSAMVLGSDAYRGALEPTSLDEAWKIAETMATIRYCGVESSAEALGRIMTGRGLGLSAMQSMRGIYAVHGRPGIDAALMQALCLQSPLCEYFRFVPEESDDDRATYVAKRRGDPEVKHTFTIQDAERMGVVDRGTDAKAKSDNNWVKVRKAMLRARAKSELARIVFPDLIFGMYSREELEAGFADVPGANVDPNELAGEIISAEDANDHAPVQAAKRDYAAEAEALKAKIADAKTRADRAAVRAAIEVWDGVEPFRAQVTEAYNASRKAATTAAEPAPGTSAAQPAPMPEGNLFTNASAPKEEAK